MKKKHITKVLAFCSICVISLAAAGSAVQASESHPWAFTYFGTSTSDRVNTIREGSSLLNGVSLTSCSQKGDGTIQKKGGKFVATDGYDGLSFFYTAIDPSKENFYLKADVKLIYINPKPDGQEGIALIARDSLGQDKVSDKPFYTNSMAVIGTKLKYKNKDGDSVSVKDGLGFRFFSGIKSADTAPKKGTFNVKSGVLDQSVRLKAGKTYTMILKRTNTGYHASYINENGEAFEEICYFDGKADPLCTIDKDHVYVGLAVARGCNATFSNIEFKVSDKKTDPAPQPHKITYMDPDYQITSASTSGTEKYNLVFKANSDGWATPKLNDLAMPSITVKAGKEITQPLYLPDGDSQVSIVFTPSSSYEPAPYTRLSSYLTKIITKTITKKTYPGTVLYAAADGTADAQATKQSPISLTEAVKYAAPGQSIYLAPGKYSLSNLKIERGIDGTADGNITLETDPAMNGHAILDFGGQGTGFQLWGNYWHLKNLDITRTKDMKAGLQVAGSYNVVELVNAYDNGNTGIQVSGTSKEPFEKWPSHNLILHCSSYNNSDAAMEDADGFAAKLTCGDGNVFNGCIASYNADDGWDLFAKVTTGSIGAVTIENCAAYKNGYINKNGQIVDAGNGNGFKMGGSGLSGHHVLKNSISYENKNKGIDSNSCPDIEVYHSISYNNQGANVALYGNKGDKTGFKADGVISYRDNDLDVPEIITLVGQDLGGIYTDNNYFYNGKHSVNSLGTAIQASMFASLDTKRVPVRNQDGSIDMQDLLVLTDSAPKCAGARMEGALNRPAE